MILRRHPFAAAVSVIVIALLWTPLTIVAINAVNRNELLVVFLDDDEG